MTPVKRPIHPIYNEICEERSRQSAAVAKLLEDPTPEKLYQFILKLRERQDELSSAFPLPETIRTTKEITHNNITVKVTIFRPLGTENQVLPVLVYCHGGGWVRGSVITHGKVASDFCIGTHAMVVFLEYTLSPEVKYPVANEEAYALLCWLHENAASIQGDPEKIVYLGDSAGGNMSAVLSLMAKERGLGDAIKCQVLIYPATSPETDWESYQKYGQGDYPLSLKDGELFAGSYFPAPTKEMQDRYATPLISTLEQLTGLPPAFVITAECDILRDEGEAYGAKLLEAGVETAGIRVTGAIHGFMSMPVPETPQYRSALTSAIDFIKVQLKLN